MNTKGRELYQVQNQTQGYLEQNQNDPQRRQATKL